MLVPSLLLGGAFLATAAWVDGLAAANRSLALLIGGVLMASGGLVQLLPDSGPRSRSGTSARTIRWITKNDTCDLYHSKTVADLVRWADRPSLLAISYAYLTVVCFLI